MSSILCLVIVFAIVLVTIESFTLNMKQFSRTEILEPFRQGNALKIISGLNNYDAAVVKNVAWAANHGGASCVDIACNPELVRIAKSVCKNIPICVSSVKPSDFVEAVNAGADMVEIGNFDSFYGSDINFSSEDILNLTKETRRLLPDVVLSVTVPHVLSLAEQIDLAMKLENCGADIIQTEGKMVANVAGMGVQQLIEIAAPTLASAFQLSRSVDIPVMCSSGLSDITAPLALSCGARGVGVGSMVNKLKYPQQMLLAVKSLAQSINRQSSHQAMVEDIEIAKTASVSSNSFLSN